MQQITDRKALEGKIIKSIKDSGEKIILVTFTDNTCMCIESMSYDYNEHEIGITTMSIDFDKKKPLVNKSLVALGLRTEEELSSYKKEIRDKRIAKKKAKDKKEFDRLAKYFIDGEDIYKEDIEPQEKEKIKPPPYKRKIQLDLFKNDNKNN